MAEATEIISVVRIGVSLVEYIYKVFSSILKDSGGAEVSSNNNNNNNNKVRSLVECLKQRIPVREGPGLIPDRDNVFYIFDGCHD